MGNLKQATENSEAFIRKQKIMKPNMKPMMKKISESNDESNDESNRGSKYEESSKRND